VSSDAGITSVAATLLGADERRDRQEEVVVEAPLEIRVAGDALALTMRTPGDDRFLAVGFLFAEGVITGVADLGSVYHCGRPDDQRYGHSIEVIPAGGAHLDIERLERSRRVGITTSACGVCGRDAIDDLTARVTPVPSTITLPRSLLARAPQILQRQQPNFARTGGLHGVAALDTEGQVVASAEDIGRHNAVDKVVGKLLYAGVLPRGRPSDGPPLLVVSGRASFEVIQKAAVAGFAGVVSVSAASSLAIETASALGVTLAAFARDGRFTVYSHGGRIVD
jgi:FdhD protein